MSARLHTDVLRQQINDGLLLRGDWAQASEDGRQRLCAYTAIMDDRDARPNGCPSDLMPEWFATLIPWMDDNGSKSAWLDQMRRLADVADRMHIITPAGWRRAEKAVRIFCVREAVSHITVDRWGVRRAAELVRAALESGDAEQLAAAGAAAGAAGDATRAAASDRIIDCILSVLESECAS